jgi:hypothetical protein
VANVLIAALILASAAPTLSLAIANRIPGMPPELLFLQWAGVIAPFLGAAALLGVRVFARRDAKEPADAR